jgi:hypothetical protein
VKSTRWYAALALGFLALGCGCEYGFTLPSSDPGVASPSIGQKLGIRTRRNILPGEVTGPAPPEPGITSAQCSTLTDGGDVRDGQCVTDTIECGQTIIGHTRGGVRRFDTGFYESAFCTPATTNHDGGDERVYKLDLPNPQMRAIATLDTPCGNLDLAAVKYSGDVCPSASSNIGQCEMYPKAGTKREVVDMFNNHPTTWWLIVEGQDDSEGAFSLTVQCLNW